MTAAPEPQNSMSHHEAHVTSSSTCHIIKHMSHHQNSSSLVSLVGTAKHDAQNKGGKKRNKIDTWAANSSSLAHPGEDQLKTAKPWTLKKRRGGGGGKNKKKKNHPFKKKIKKINPKLYAKKK